MQTMAESFLLRMQRILIYLFFFNSLYFREADDARDVRRDFVWWFGPKPADVRASHRLCHPTADRVLPYRQYPGWTDWSESHHKGWSRVQHTKELIEIKNVECHVRLVFLAEHPCGKHFPGGPVWVGHVGEGQLSRNFCAEAVLWARTRRRVCHHYRLQHPRPAQLASEDVRLQVRHAVIHICITKLILRTRKQTQLFLTP